MSGPQNSHPVAIEGRLELAYGTRPVAIVHADGVRVRMDVVGPRALLTLVRASGPRRRRAQLLSHLQARLADARLAAHITLSGIVVAKAGASVARKSGATATLLAMPLHVRPLGLLYALARGVFFRAGAAVRRQSTHCRWRVDRMASASARYSFYLIWSPPHCVVPRQFI